MGREEMIVAIQEELRRLHVIRKVLEGVMKPGGRPEKFFV